MCFKLKIGRTVICSITFYLFNVPYMSHVVVSLVTILKELAWNSIPVSQEPSLRWMLRGLRRWVVLMAWLKVVMKMKVRITINGRQCT